VASRTGSWTGWQQIELRGWNTRFDFGRESGQWLTETLLGPGDVFPTFVALLVLVTVALAVVSVRRTPWPFVLFGIGVLVLTLCTAGLPFAKIRFLLPAFVLLIPIALGLGRRRTATTVAVLAGYVLACGWFSAYSLVIWQHAI
jgi:hypothetical protein